MATLYEHGLGAVAAFLALPWPSGCTFEKGPVSGPQARIKPDCRVTYPGGQSVPVEVKKTSSGISQLRPLDYHTTVVWRDPDLWWVLAPQDVLLLACSHAGQHCISPLECFNPGPPSAAWQRWSVPPAQVPDRVLKAHASGQMHAMRQMVQAIRTQIQDLCNMQVAQVKRLGA